MNSLDHKYKDFIASWEKEFHHGNYFNLKHKRVFDLLKSIRKLSTEQSFMMVVTYLAIRYLEQENPHSYNLIDSAEELFDSFVEAARWSNKLT